MPPAEDSRTNASKMKMPHVLRPHHVSLLMIMMCVFKEMHRKLPAAFLLHVYRILLREVSEVSQPTPFAELMQELESGPMAGDDVPQMMMSVLKGPSTDLVNVDQITHFFNAIVYLFITKSDDSSPFARRSLFGYFGRRCFVTFVKLSFTGAAKLQQDYHAWRSGDSEAGYEPVRTDYFDDDAVLFKTKADRKARVQTEPFMSFEEGFSDGDEITAADSLRAFFEQHFHESRDSGFRQHALLQHSRMHYLREEFAEARRLLQEAAALCRVKNDKLTLMHCMALLHRLPPIEHGQKAVLNEIQPELHPLEVLYDVRKLIDEANDQPLSVAFKRIIESIGLYDHYVELQGHEPVYEEQWGQHGVQAIVWRIAGRSRLAAVERSIVAAFTEGGGNDNNRLNATLSLAYERARQGRYEHGLAILLDPDVWGGIDLAQYPEWAAQVWHILVLRSSRRKMLRQFREILLPRRPTPIFKAHDYWFLTYPNRLNLAAPLLRDVMHMRKSDQAPAAVEQLLSALWKSEFQCRYALYRTGIVMLADVGLEFGLSKKCRQIIEEIMPQIRADGDTEQKGLAYFTLARCIVASGEGSRDALREALPWLVEAEAAYEALSMHKSLADVQYFLAIMYHNLEDHQERDATSARHLESEELAKKAEGIVVEDEVMQVWRIVTEVGAALTARS